ncbi:MAG TPA: hypothetical protein VGP99_13910 [Tepidisphaeraceae bacterium]|jgi:hypothetical protein|nr:hypothetical protein [Tepidisphaeraceae bacterium]
MRISLLLIAAIFCSMLLGCGSVNNNQTRQRPINPHDPLMTTRYLNSRAQH